MLPEICSFEQLCRLVQIFSPDGSIHGPLPVINKSSAALLLVNCTVHSYYLELALIKKYIYN